MTGAVTVEQVLAFVTLASALFGLWLRIERAIAAARAKAAGDAEKLQREISDFREKVAEEYARVGFIKDVDARSAAQFKILTDEIHKLRESFERYMMTKGSRRP
jgi:outer membrane protein TolC